MFYKLLVVEHGVTWKIYMNMVETYATDVVQTRYFYASSEMVGAVVGIRGNNSDGEVGLG